MAGVEHPVACMSGNPAAAGVILLARTDMLYHGDFDWPGIAIARRIFGQGARLWRFGRIDTSTQLTVFPLTIGLA